jgi:LPS-assembly protein
MLVSQISHQKLIRRIAIISLLMTGASTIPQSFAATLNPDISEPQPKINPPPEEQVDFQATTISYDETSQIITAEGQVEVAQAGRIVKSDKIIYNLPQDKVEAVGNVVMMDKNGDVHFFRQSLFRSRFKDYESHTYKTGKFIS